MAVRVQPGGNNNILGSNALTASDEILDPVRISSSVAKIAQIASDDPELWNRKGVILARAGQHREALECFERALKLAPNHEGAWLNKGKTLLALDGTNGDRERDALRCCERALELKPLDAEAWYLKGVILARLDKMESALIAYQRSIELDSNHGGSWYGMGLAARHLGFKNRAEECFKMASKLGVKVKK